MAIETIKFSEFSDGGDLEPNQITVGLDNTQTINTRFTNPFPLLPPGSTGDRPAPDPNMYYRLRFNTSLESYEYYSPTLVAWVQLSDETDILPLLASHLPGEGASLIGLENQGTVVDKTVQDLANATFICNTDNGTLENAQIMSLLATGIVKNTTTTGIQSVLTGSTTITAVINDDTMATAATTNLSTSLAIKNYVDAQFGAGVTPVQVQQSAFNYGLDTGVADAYVVALSPVVGAVTEGLVVGFVPLNNNLTTNPTLTVDGTPYDIVLPGESTVPIGALNFNVFALCVFNAGLGTFVLLTSAMPASSVTPEQVQSFAFNYGIDSGVADAYAVTLSPPIASYTPGLFITFYPANANTNTTPTIDIDGVGPVGIQKLSPVSAGANLMPGDLSPSTIAYLMWDGVSSFLLLNPCTGWIDPALALRNTLINLSEQGGSAADAYVFNYPIDYGNLGIYASGLMAIMQTSHANTGAATIEISSHPSVSLNKPTGALVAGDILANIPYLILFDGSNFTLLNPSTGYGAAGVTAQEVQQSAFNYGPDSGTADDYQVTLTPAISSYTEGLLVSFVPAHANLTLNPTLNVNGMGATPIVLMNQTIANNPAAGDLNGATAFLIYSSFYGFILINPQVSTATSQLVQRNFLNRGTDTGVADDYVVTLTPTLVGSYYDGMTISFIAGNSNTISTPQLTVVDGGGAQQIFRPGNLPLQVGDIVGGALVYVIHGNSSWIILNPANPQLAVPGGSDTQMQYNNMGALDGDTGFTTDGAGTLTAVSLGWSDTTKGLRGTVTNDDADAGFVGEYVSSVVLVGSAVALTSGAGKSITSVSLTAGDWDVWGDFGPSGASTTVLQAINGGISTTDNTILTAAADNATVFQSGTVSFTIGASSIPYYNLTPARISIAATTSVYLVMNVTFATSTASGFGKICARRRR